MWSKTNLSSKRIVCMVTFEKYSHTHICILRYLSSSIYDNEMYLRLSKYVFVFIYYNVCIHRVATFLTSNSTCRRLYPQNSSIFSPFFRNPLPLLSDQGWMAPLYSNSYIYPYLYTHTHIHTHTLLPLFSPFIYLSFLVFFFHCYFLFTYPLQM